MEISLAGFMLFASWWYWWGNEWLYPAVEYDHEATHTQDRFGTPKDVFAPGEDVYVQGAATRYRACPVVYRRFLGKVGGSSYELEGGYGFDFQPGYNVARVRISGSDIIGPGEWRFYSTGFHNCPLGNVQVISGFQATFKVME